jgi:hypothetical protein
MYALLETPRAVRLRKLFDFVCDFSGSSMGLLERVPAGGKLIQPVQLWHPGERHRTPMFPFVTGIWNTNRTRLLTPPRTSSMEDWARLYVHPMLMNPIVNALRAIRDGMNQTEYSSMRLGSILSNQEGTVMFMNIVNWAFYLSVHARDVHHAAGMTQAPMKALSADADYALHYFATMTLTVNPITGLSEWVR